MHLLMAVLDLHLPSLEEQRLFETIDLMIRQNYDRLSPLAPSTWSHISGQSATTNQPLRATPSAAAVVGISGTGKSEAISRCLSLYPNQVIRHDSFFRMVNGLTQPLFLSLNAPFNGKADQLGLDLMIAYRQATGSTRFDEALESRSKQNGPKLLREWLQVASSHFLGLLHIDEIQNLFKLATVASRKHRNPGSRAPELRIVEDETLKWILTFLNTSRIPLLISGTPDGMSAIQTRISNTQRLTSFGHHVFKHFEGDNESTFKQHWLPRLVLYQYVARPLAPSDELVDLILTKTGGVQRLIIALWIAAHRVAFERKDDDLRLEDFQTAADTNFALVSGAVDALRSNDPRRLERYEDLYPRDPGLWAQIFGPTLGP
ncbi:AAA family ATPase [Acidovorax sp. CF316]|uniref:AAA family ATPase n=1 Tax=Acidovorax sp. CF316 TaxID=1144317 RepID=UPI000D350E82|nr:AAA family ATPase [Acidovorax sp. CF316]